MSEEEFGTEEEREQVIYPNCCPVGSRGFSFGCFEALF